MTKVITVTESQPSVVELDDSAAQALALLGRKLASNATWWGASLAEADRSVIALDRTGAGRYRVIFRDVVGVVRVGDAQFEVQPKIPLDHFLFLAGQTDLAPRGQTGEVRISQSVELIGLICRWLLSAAEQLLRVGLRKGYGEFIDSLPVARGRVLACETAAHVLCGRARITCEFDDLSYDTPLNRLIKAGCETVSMLSVLDDETRGRGRRVAYRMDGVGPLQHSDGRVGVDRLTASYAKAIPLARLVLEGCGASTSYGFVRGSTFLIRTPDLIEDGFRAALASQLPEIDVVKQKLMLGETGLSMSPDLVFQKGAAVGDVKYRFLSSYWSRSDLYQVVAFATAFGADRAGVFAFSAGGVAVPPPVPVGPVLVKPFAWLASHGSKPRDSLKVLAERVRAWLM